MPFIRAAANGVSGESIFSYPLKVIFRYGQAGNTLHIAQDIGQKDSGPFTLDDDSIGVFHIDGFHVLPKIRGLRNRTIKVCHKLLYAELHILRSKLPHRHGT